jgi:hypothetical protein
LLAALLPALTAWILLLLAGFLLRILLAALLTALAALLPALIWIVGHWKRLLIAGRPRKNCNEPRTCWFRTRARNLLAI